MERKEGLSWLMSRHVHRCDSVLGAMSVGHGWVWGVG